MPEMEVRSGRINPKLDPQRFAAGKFFLKLFEGYYFVRTAFYFLKPDQLLLIFGITDVNKIAISSFGASLIVLFNSAYGVINARKQRVMAAKVRGASRWPVF